MLVFIKKVAFLFCLYLSIQGAFTLDANAAQGHDQKEDFVIYGLYRGVQMDDADGPVEKDYYVNMGTRHGIREGSHLEVLHALNTLDPLLHHMQPELLFPIADIRVIRVAPTVAVARLQKMRPSANTPIFTPVAIMLGDRIRQVRMQAVISEKPSR